MYSIEFLKSLGLNPAEFDPDCEPERTKGPRGESVLINEIPAF